MFPKAGVLITSHHTWLLRGRWESELNPLCFRYKHFTQWTVFTDLQMFFLSRQFWSWHVLLPVDGKHLHPCLSWGSCTSHSKAILPLTQKMLLWLKLPQHPMPPGKDTEGYLLGSKGHLFQRTFSLVRFRILRLHEIKQRKNRVRRGSIIGS